MKKRFLCALLVSALCIGEVFPAAAAVTPATGTDTVAEVADEQVIAEEEKAQQETAEAGVQEAESVQETASGNGEQEPSEEAKESADAVQEEAADAGEQQMQEAADADRETEQEAADADRETVQEAADANQETVQEAADAAQEAVTEADADEAAAQDTKESVAEEIDAEGEATEEIKVYPTQEPSKNFSYGVDATIEFSFSPNKTYKVYVYPKGSNDFKYAQEVKAGAEDPVNGMAHEKVVFPFGSQKTTYTPGDYVMIVKYGDSQVYTWSFKIARSINPAENKELVTVPTVVESSVVYTGKDVVPQITIVDKVNGANKTLKQGTDFTVTVTDANKKNVGASAARITGIGSYSGIYDLKFTIRPQAPNLPSVVCLTSSSAKVTWNKIATAQKYRIYRKKSSEKNYIQMDVVNGADTVTYVDSKNLEPGETYQYYITASIGDYESIGNTAGTTFKMTTGAPKLKSAASVNTKTVKLIWDKVTGATGYNVYQVNADGSLKLLKADKKTDNFKVNKLKCGTSYKFAVKAYVLAKDGRTKLESASSNVLTVKAKPATPKLVSVKSVGAKRVEIKWKKVSDCSGYMIYKKRTNDEDATWSKVKTVKGKSKVSAIDTKAKPGIKYSYTVLAYKTVKGKKIKGDMNAKGKSVSSKCEAPEVVIIRVKTDTNEIVIKNVEGASGYYIYRKMGNESFKRIKTVKNSGFETTVFYDQPVDSSYLYTYYIQPYTELTSKKVKGQKTGEIVEKRLVPKTTTTKK